MLTYAILGISHVHTATLHRELAAFGEETRCIGWADTPSHDKQNPGEKRRVILGEFAESLTEYEDYHDLIAQKPDVAIVCCDNADCAKIGIECLSQGIHVVLEKPMTESYEDALKLQAASKQYGKEVIVNWPIAGFHAFNKAKMLADEGRIGKILRVVYRSPATWGPYSWGSNPDAAMERLKQTWWSMRRRGGGSILDYACYGAALATWFFGRRARVVHTVAKNFCLPGMDVEDYSAMLLDFGDGVGLLEGSWATFNCGEVPTGPVIYGTEGTIVCDRHSSLVKVYTGRSHTPIPPTEVIDCSDPLPETGFGFDVLNHFTKGTELHPIRRCDLNVDVMYILDEGLKAADAALGRE